MASTRRSPVWHTLDDVAEQAEVDRTFVERLHELGAIGRDGSFTETDVRRARLLHAWEEAGLRADDVMHLVDAGKLSIAWLDTPVMTRAGLLDVTVEQVAKEVGVEIGDVQAVYEAIGFAPPRPDDLVRAG